MPQLLNAAPAGAVAPVRSFVHIGLSTLCVAALAACGGGGAEEPPTEVRPWAAAASTASACDAASGRVLRVGRGQALATPSAAAAVAQDGDVVRIERGDYRGDVATWKADRLTICGDGGRARLFADGRSAQGKAIWVVAGADVTIDGIEFHQARVADRNGAGIRAEHTGRLRVVNSGFYDNQNGILGGKGAVLEIERSEFARNGHGDGQSHNLYVGQARSLSVSNSYFHEARVGHNLKSRAAINRIENSYFVDGPQGTASYLADFPDGGDVFLRGNLFHKGPKAENSVAIAYAAERQTWSQNTLTLVHNTVVMTRPGGHYLRAPAHTQSVRLTANLFAGSPTAQLIKGGFLSGNVQQSGNVWADAGQVPGADHTARPDFWPVASLREALVLPGVADAQYRADAPGPFVQRALQGARRLSGALQSDPAQAAGQGHAPGGNVQPPAPAPAPAPVPVSVPVVKPPAPAPATPPAPALPPQVQPEPPAVRPSPAPAPRPVRFGPRPGQVPPPLACQPQNSPAGTAAATGQPRSACPVPVVAPPRPTTCQPFRCAILQRPAAALPGTAAARAAG